MSFLSIIILLLSMCIVFLGGYGYGVDRTFIQEERKADKKRQEVINRMYTDGIITQREYEHYSNLAD